jgi:6-phosphogluconolactonase
VPVPSGRTILYSALGTEMSFHDIDVEAATLTRLGAITLDEIIQYAWPNRARTILYVAMSGAGPMVKVKRPDHFVQAFRIQPSGALVPYGPSIRLAHRPLHLSLDVEERHLLLCSNDPPDVTVHRIAADGSIGAPVPQMPLDFGVTAHQVRVTPAGNIAIVPACAHHPTGEIPGSLRLFSYSDGKLAPLAVIDADPARAAAWQNVRNGAHGFAVRHVDFHPTRRWMYLCLETQCEIRLYDYSETGLAPAPRFIKSTLEGTELGRARQAASAIHVHPNGRFVYVSNRAQGTEEFRGAEVFAGGVNDIAAFEIDERTGEPVLIQHIETHGFFPRTFGIDPSGRVLVVGNQDPGAVRDGEELRRVLPSLVVYRVGKDGKLTFVSKQDHPNNGQVCFWVGIERVSA